MVEQQNDSIWHTHAVCVPQTHTCVCVHLYADFEYLFPKQVFALTGLGHILRGQSCVRRPFWSQIACRAQVGPGHFGHRNPDLWTQFIFGPSITFLHLSVKSLILEPHIFQIHRVLPLERQIGSKLSRNWVHGFRDNWVQRQHTQTNWVHKANWVHRTDWVHKTNWVHKPNWVHKTNWVHDSIVFKIVQNRVQNWVHSSILVRIRPDES